MDDARTRSPGPTAIFIRALLLLYTLQAVLHAAQPAERPWPRQPGRPAAATAAAGTRPPTGRPHPQRHRTQSVNGPVRVTSPTGGARRNGRGTSRRRGSRGGVNWRRHGDTGAQQLIIGQLNIQSYKPKIHDLRNDIRDVYGFDVLALCETWLTPSVPDRLMGVEGYKLYRRDRPANIGLPKGRGGVAVLVRDSLSCELLPTPVTGIANSNLEIVWILVRPSKHRSMLMASAYRVPHNTTHQIAADLDDLESQIQHMVTNFPRATLMIGGDLNCCLLRTRNSTSVNPLQRLCDTYGLNVTNKTHATYRPSGSLLGVIITSRPDLIRRCGRDEVSLWRTS